MNSTYLDASAILALIQRFVGSDPDALDRMRQQVEGEIASAELMLGRARVQLDAINKLQAVLDVEAPPEGQQRVPGTEPVAPIKAVRSPSAPSLRVAILHVLGENPGRPWTRDDLLDELNRRGWGPTSQNPRNTLNSRLFELTKAEMISRDEDEFFLPRKVEVPTA